MIKGNVREIIKDIDELDKPCEIIDPVKESKLTQQIILDLKTTMREYGLTYLTAPQIGEKYRIFCMKTDKDTYKSYVNPIIESSTNGMCINRECCCSIPNAEFLRCRFNRVRVIFQSPLGVPDCVQADGPTAWLLQHCIDHLDGMVLPFIGLEIDEMFDNATKEEQNQVIEMYLESLDIRNKEIQNEIQEDPKLKEMYDAINFIEKAKKGEIEFDKDVRDKKE